MKELLASRRSGGRCSTRRSSRHTSGFAGFRAALAAVPSPLVAGGGIARAERRALGTIYTPRGERDRLLGNGFNQPFGWRTGGGINCVLLGTRELPPAPSRAGTRTAGDRTMGVWGAARVLERRGASSASSRPRAR